MELDKKNEIAELIKKSKNIIVFTGAGISTNCGIPDFRSEKGLYSYVQERYNLPYPEAIFDISYFRTKPDAFFDLSKNFFTQEMHPSVSHEFLSWLEKNNKISLIVTQNIDMLHQRAGSKKVLECHGTYETAHCMNCHKKYDITDIEPSLKNGEAPECECKGIIKPDIVFFGEQLPSGFYEIYQNPPPSDLVLVMGTSLTVQPAASFALKLTEKVNSVIVNFTKTSYDHLFTHVINEDIDDFSREIWEMLE